MALDHFTLDLVSISLIIPFVTISSILYRRPTSDRRGTGQSGALAYASASNDSLYQLGVEDSTRNDYDTLEPPRTDLGDP